MFAGYPHFRGNVSGNVDFLLYDVGSSFAGRATSHVITAGVAREFSFSGGLAVTTSAGEGVASNMLSRLFEKDVASGLFSMTAVAAGRPASVARISVQAHAEDTAWPGRIVRLWGDLRTSDWRGGNLGVTEVRLYLIGGLWQSFCMLEVPAASCFGGVQ